MGDIQFRTLAGREFAGQKAGVCKSTRSIRRGIAKADRPAARNRAHPVRRQGDRRIFAPAAERAASAVADRYQRSRHAQGRRCREQRRPHPARHRGTGARHAGHGTGAAQSRRWRRTHVFARSRLSADALRSRCETHRGARAELERLLGSQACIYRARAPARRGGARSRHPRLLSARVPEERSDHARIPVRSLSRALGGVRSQDDGRVSRLWAAPVAARQRLSRQAVRADVASQRRERHPAADRRFVSDDETRRSQGRVGQSGRRAHGPLGAMAAAYDSRPRRDAVDRARLRVQPRKKCDFYETGYKGLQWQLQT